MAGECKYKVYSSGAGRWGSSPSTQSVKRFSTLKLAKGYAKKRFLSGKLVSIEKECKRFTTVASYDCGKTYGGGFACEKERYEDDLGKRKRRKRKKKA